MIHNCAGVCAQQDGNAQKSETEIGIPRALLVFVLIFAVRPFVNAQIYLEVTPADGEFYQAPELTLPEDLTVGVASSNPPLSLPDVSSSGSQRADVRQMPNWGAKTFIETKPEAKRNKDLRWRVANEESLLFTGIMHTFNIWTEPGTRDTLNGHWFQQYIQSVSEMRGWSDSDMFMAPYVGHTIEGSVFGYILRQNDPKYRAVQWGDGREYFISLLRSLAYSAVWHTQWKIGPASEASIGNVMLHASPGFITLTDTPTLGTVEMLAEDAADRYVITGLENRTTNPFLLLLTRSFVNPGRAFANVMAFRVPWHRETRIDLFGQNHQIRKELIRTYHETGEKAFEYVRPPRAEGSTGPHPKEAPIELSAFPVFQKFLGGGSCIGGGGSGAGRINSSWQFVAEGSGCLVMHMPSSDQSGDSLFYGGGVRWTPRASHIVSPYLQFMIGGNKVTHETDNIPLRERLMAEWNDGSGTLPHYPLRSAWSVEITRNAPALKLAGGFDVVVARPFAWRLLDLEYSHAWMDDVVNIHPQNTLRISTGAVLRIGTW